MSLDELRALEQAATAAPWFVVGPPWNEGEPWINAGSADPHAGRYVCEFDSNSLADIADENLGANAALVVAARNALPGLLGRVAAAEAERDALRSGTTLTEADAESVLYALRRCAALVPHADALLRERVDAIEACTRAIAVLAASASGVAEPTTKETR